MVVKAPCVLARTLIEAPLDDVTFTRSWLWKFAPSTTSGAPPCKLSDGRGGFAVELAVAISATKAAKAIKLSDRTSGWWHHGDVLASV